MINVDYYTLFDENCNFIDNYSIKGLKSNGSFKIQDSKMIGFFIKIRDIQVIYQRKAL